MIHRLLKVAISNAIDADEYQKLSKRNEVLTLQKSLSSQEEMEVTNILERIDRASVRAKTLTDFRFTLEEFGLSHENVIDFLAHENAHANKADQLSDSFQYYILTILLRDGKLVGQPATIFDFDHTDPETRHRLQQITNAPLEFGSKLSEGDEESLLSLKDQEPV